MKSQIEEQMVQAIKTRFNRYKGERVRCPSLNRMGEFIRERLGYDVEIKKSWINTDGKVVGHSRLRRPGKGREGNKILVYMPNHKYGDSPIYTHDSSGTYRHNTEVAEWILNELQLQQEHQAEAVDSPSRPTATEDDSE